jgi:predicted RNase H-like HicB family nuclease
VHSWTSTNHNKLPPEPQFIAGDSFLSDFVWSSKEFVMQVVKYVHWQEDDIWIGYLQDHPDYWTQGETLEDLIDHLTDLHQDLTGDKIPGTRKVAELVIP